MRQGLDNAALERILEYLRQTRGFDFTAYKRTSLIRRLRKRMQTVDIDTFEAYQDHLEVHPDEFVILFNTILINVTSFFRDPELWATLRETVIPQLLSTRGPQDPLRVWSAGCASGQEAYSIAMLFAEAIGLEAFRERVKIYATDVDEEALTEARHAGFDEKAMASVPPELVPKYFDRSGKSFGVQRELRRAVIFGRHDLIQDAPISRVDLLLCRNTLMYFNAETQSRIMARFYFSVNSGGYLVLGRAEMLFNHASMFTAVDLKRRIFRTVPKIGQRDRLLLIGHAEREDFVASNPNHDRLRDAAFDLAGEAQIVLDANSTLIAANAAARRQFGLTSTDIGSPFQDLELSYRPVELRGSLDRARGDRREVTLRAVAYELNGVVRYADVTITPLLTDSRGFLGCRIAFADVTPIKTLEDELTHSKQELDTAYEELQSTNEELETTNEELQSTVEELETTNEELQSTNEELETMNEELQSTNEELQTMNDELRNRSTELNSANAFLEAVFTSLRSAVVVLDREHRVQVWNQGAGELWGVRPDEAQRANFFGLDIGLPVSHLLTPIREILAGSAESRQLTLEATNRRGKKITCHVTLMPLVAADRSVSGAIVLMDAAP
jgi:two-component system CheB/CheR fusion protein